jgi:prolipoprotein diacylglyceryltransferase
VPSAVVTFEFDPQVPFAGISVSWEALGTAGAILLALVAAAVLARRTPPDAEGRRLHMDDLLSLAIAAVPGAIVGGRIGYALIHLDYYSSHAGALLDAGQGSFQLSLAVAGGLLTATYLARVLDAPIGRWAHVAAVPLLLAIEGGKAAMAWGGTGQGTLSSAEWATRYLGDGPWGSLAPELPSQPSQLYEAAVVLGIGAALVAALAAGGFRRRDGRLLLAALGLWLLGRAVVASTWRDPAVLGPFCADQVISIVLVVLVLLGLVILRARSFRSARAPSAPIWPDATAAESWRGSARG